MEDISARNKYIRYLFPLLLVLVALFLSATNYTPGTFLSGWDTLHPEFDFSLYWERIFDGAWQEHQGLGTVATQAHAAEIPRVIILQLLNIFFPVSFLRYAYAFLMLILGPLGMYFFLNYLLRNKNEFPRTLAAFCGAMFYLLNLSTMQHFYVPLEMFLTHFGFLGWLMLFAYRFYEGDKKSLLWLGLVSFFSAPQAHTSTLFVSLLLFLFTFLFALIIKSGLKGFRMSAKKVGWIAGVLLFTNAFWLGPNLYFVLTKAEEVSESKIHRLFSEEAFLQNREYGTIDKTAVLKGFLFNWGEHVGDGEYGDLLNEWDSFYLVGLAQYIGYAFFGLALLGVILMVTKEETYFLPSFSIFLLTYFFVASANFPFGFLFSFLQDNLPLFKEAFRFPFTKFSTLLAFSYALFLSYTLVFIFTKLGNIKKGKTISVLLTIFLASFLMNYMLPAFRGGLISPSMRVSIPDRYFEMFEYFDSQKEYGRVVNLPIHSFWGWVYYNWNPSTKMGYQGAGFTWFGIKQPLLDREFDRWGAPNEQYYREMSYAVYSQDLKLFESILNKYQVKWIILDKSVFQPGAGDKILFLEEINSLLTQSSKITGVKDFGEGLEVHVVGNSYNHLEEIAAIYGSGDSFTKESYDPIYFNHGDYVVSEDDNFPFVGVTSTDEALLSGVLTSSSTGLFFPLEDRTEPFNADRVSLSVQLSGDSKGGFTLRVRDLLTEEVLTEVPVDLPNSFVLDFGDKLISLKSSEIVGEFSLGEITLERGTPLEIDVFVEEEGVRTFSPDFSVLEPCSFVGAQTAYTLETNKSGFDITARNVRACVTTPLKLAVKLPTEENFVLRTSVETKETGASANLCLLDDRTGVCEGEYEVSGSELNVFNFLSGSELDHYYLRFFANSRDKSETSVSYNNLTFSTLNKVDTLSFDIPEYEIGKSQKENEGLEFGYSLFLDASDLALLSSPYVCGSGSREFDESTSVEYTQQAVTYRASRDFLCDTYNLITLNASKGYLLRITTKNIEGLPLRACLTSTESTRCNLYVSLPNENGWSTSHYFVPPMGDGGYILNLTSLVFGEGNQSLNEVGEISFTELPYGYMKSLSSSQDTTKKDVLVLREAFDPGWIALCGASICNADHVLISNWANGWISRDGKDLSEAKTIFWPQILQYFGYFALFGTLLFLVIKAKRDRSITTP